MNQNHEIAGIMNCEIMKCGDPLYAVFYGEFENEKKKRQNIFDLPERGFEPQIFSNFPTHDLNFHGR